MFGVGDRHLDNILLRSNGSFFHCDFGYIFGSNPKSFSGLMRFPREVLNGMGGFESPVFRRCVRLAEEAYLCLRRHTQVIVNILWTMNRANITDLSVINDKYIYEKGNHEGFQRQEDSGSVRSTPNNQIYSSSDKVLNVIRDVHARLHMELSDIEACKHLRRTIYESLNAVMPNVMESLHKLSMVFK